MLKSLPHDRRRACALVIALAMVPAAAAHGRPGPDDDELVRIAQTFARHLAEGKHEEAAKLNDETMAKAAPADKLKLIWESIEASSGEFQSFGSPSTSKQGGYHIVIIPAAFKNATVNLKIVLDAEGRVSGLWTLPGTPAEAYELPDYDRPGSYTETDVEFGEPPWTVKGKLTRPRTRAIVPAIVLVHGSGPHDEDETIGPNKPFRDLAAGLSSNGIAVLRYQKRTHAHKLRLAVKGTITVREEVIDDALAAVGFLREQSGIDRSKIFVLGHSLGATMAPHIAAEDEKIAGAILLAGSARDFYDVIDEQLEYIASLPGPGQAANKTVREDVRKAIARLRAGEDADKIRILDVAASYWNEVNDYAKRSLTTAKNLKCRLYITAGGRDYQVTRKDFDLYRAELGNRKNVQFRWYEKLNHLFMRGDKKATPAEYAQPGHVDEALIRDLVAWINER